GSEKTKLLGAIFDLFVDSGVQKLIEQLPVNRAGDDSHRLEVFSFEFGLHVSVLVGIMADGPSLRFTIGFAHKEKQFLGPERQKGPVNFTGFSIAREKGFKQPACVFIGPEQAVTLVCRE